MYDLKGGDDSPELGFGGGEASEPRVLIDDVEGGVRGRDEEPDRFLAGVNSALGAGRTRQTERRT